MARFPEAEKRIFEGKWVCMNSKCGAVMRAPEGKKPDRCRSCGRTDLRIKHKTKKK